jgi:hypothetical protein
LDVVAPGIFIRTTEPYTNDYISLCNGTSSATAYVSGLAALILAVDSNLTERQVRNIIEYTAQKVRPDLYNYRPKLGRPNGRWHEEMGYGLVDAYAAVVMAQTFNNAEGIDLMIRDAIDLSS